MPTDAQTREPMFDSPSEDEPMPVLPAVPKHVFDELLAAAARVNQHYLEQRPPTA
jgi:hypothetical protein